MPNNDDDDECKAAVWAWIVCQVDDCNALFYVAWYDVIEDAYHEDDMQCQAEVVEIGQPESSWSCLAWPFEVQIGSWAFTTAGPETVEPSPNPIVHACHNCLP